MGLTSLQVCMDSSDWLQGTINEESGMDSSSLSGDMLSCSRPLTERRLRPQHDQALKCPRCDSTHTKFCYYNNYSLSQPRYFCKTCRRYWTKGGTLRNIPVGGGCRKNKKVASSSSNNNKKSNDPTQQQQQTPITQLTHNQQPTGPGGSSSHIHNPTDLHLSFPDHHPHHQLQFSHFNSTAFMVEANKYNNNIGMLENPRPPLPPIDFLEHYPGNAEHLGLVGGLGLGLGGDHQHHNHNHHITGPAHALSPNFHGFCSPYGMTSTMEAGNTSGTTAFMETCHQRSLMIHPYDNEGNEDHTNAILDVKPNTKLLALEWQDQGCSSSEKVESYGYLNGMAMGMGMGSTWNGMNMINGYGPSTTNPLV